MRKDNPKPTRLLRAKQGTICQKHLPVQKQLHHLVTDTITMLLARMQLTILLPQVHPKKYCGVHQGSLMVSTGRAPVLGLLNDELMMKEYLHS